MPISFEQIPSDTRTYGNYVEIDPTGAVEGAGIRPHTILAVGYQLATATVPENTPKSISSGEQAEGFFGRGSQLAAMCAAVLNVNDRTPLVAIGVDEVAGTPASGTFGITVTTALAGTLFAYVAGRRYNVGISAGATDTEIADALAAEINADLDAPVTAVSAGTSPAIVTTTCRWAGVEGNDIDLRVNYRITESLPSGVSVAVVPMASGATSPTVAGVITAITGTQYDTIITGFSEDANLDLFEQDLETRWGPMVDLDGHLFAAICTTKTLSENYTNVRNAKQTTILTPGPSPTPWWIVAANAGGIDGFETGQDPARPRSTLVLKDVLAPADGDRFTQTQRNQLLYGGAATTIVDGGGNVAIELLTTTYLTNSQGAVDPTWLHLTTKRTVSYLRWDWDALITLKYPRYKLADDGTLFSPGQKVVTPSTIRVEAIAWFEAKMLQGLVENLDQFRADLIVERNTQNFNRLDAILRPNIINKLVTTATRLQFRA